MGQYAEYRRPVWPWQWARWWVARWRDRHPESDGRDYTGWAARLGEGQWPRNVGTVGAVVGSRVECGELVHTIDFDGWLVTTPLPSQVVELVSPQ